MPFLYRSRHKLLIYAAYSGLQPASVNRLRKAYFHLLRCLLRHTDRVIHHYLISRLEPLWQKKFSNAIFACRKGKGPLKAIQELQTQVHKISLGGTQPVYVLQMDIKSFFPSIHRETLVKLLQAETDDNFLNWLLKFTEKIDFSKSYINHPLDKDPSFRKTAKPLATLNARLGQMKHAKSFEFRKKSIQKFRKQTKLKVRRDFCAIKMHKK